MYCNKQPQPKERAVEVILKQGLSKLLTNPFYRDTLHVFKRGFEYRRARGSHNESGLLIPSMENAFKRALVGVFVNRPPPPPASCRRLDAKFIKILAQAGESALSKKEVVRRLMDRLRQEGIVGRDMPLTIAGAELLLARALYGYATNVDRGLSSDPL